MLPMSQANFGIGQLVVHRLFGYRGVVFDVDPCFQGPDDWYESVARTRPPKDKPWYRVLVHRGMHETYVAERNLEADPSHDPIEHPLIEHLFDRFQDGMYQIKRVTN